MSGKGKEYNDNGKSPAGLGGLVGASASTNLVDVGASTGSLAHQGSKLLKIKSLFIFKKILNNLKKRKALNIVKYNKNIKKRINIDINDYKEYSEKYSSIEIEIKPVDNKYGKFMKFKKKR